MHGLMRAAARAAALAGALASGGALAVDEVALVNHLAGSVSHIRGNRAEKAKPYLKLHEGDRLSLAAGAQLRTGAEVERITVKDGAVQESNFYDYRVPRMSDVPEMHIELIQTDNHPTGAGQMSTPLVAPAISNAVAQLTGVRLRHSPFTPERVKTALG